MLLQEGDIIADKYRLITMLDEGGMGSIWVARNNTLDVDVAIKFIRADLKGVEDARLPDRLLQEARAAAQLGHPGILRVYDFGRTMTGDPFIVMELLDGEGLDMALDRRGCIDPVKAVRSLLPIADALMAAHAKGIIHRDIKPSNIIMAETAEGTIQPKLIDFGVSKHERSPLERMTMVGAIIGSPGYLAPELLYGQDATAQSDIWSFCVVLYEAIVGKLPFSGESLFDLRHAIIEADVTQMSKYVGDVELCSIIERGLEKRPEDRWTSMADLGAALASWLLAQGVTEDVCGTLLEATWSPRPYKVRDAFASSPPPEPMSDMWTQLVKEHVQDLYELVPPKPISPEPAALPELTPPAADVALRPSVVYEPERDLVRRLVYLLDEAEIALDSCDVTTTVQLGDPVVTTVLQLSEKLMEEVFEARLGGADTRFHVNAGDRPVDLSPTESMIVARVATGSNSIDALCTTAGERREIVRALLRLTERGVIAAI